jgi:hypothetical protein
VWCFLVCLFAFLFLLAFLFLEDTVNAMHNYYYSFEHVLLTYLLTWYESAGRGVLTWKLVIIVGGFLLHSGCTSRQAIQPPNRPLHRRLRCTYDYLPRCLPRCYCGPGGALVSELHVGLGWGCVECWVVRPGGLTSRGGSS